jgi:hypothetical protein
VLDFIGAHRFDVQGVNIGRHHFADRIVDPAVTRQSRQSRKRPADHSHLEVAAAIARTGVSDMQV